MKQIITSRIFRKILVLSFLLAGLGFTIFSNNTTKSVNAMAPGCCVCQEVENWCFANSGYPGAPYSTVQECMKAHGLGNCWYNCIPEPGCP